MSAKNKNTEQLILESAKEIFVEKGLDGARMQEIADHAGINKSLLHYYYRSKEKLFDAVFVEAFSRFVPKVAEAMASDAPFLKKIEIFVENYITMLQNNPHIPVFVMHEMHKNPGKLISLIKGQGLNPELFINALRKEIKEGKITSADPRHLIVSILGMCLFPVIAEPILKGFMFNGNDKAYKEFIEERKKEIVKFVKNSIEKK